MRIISGVFGDGVVQQSDAHGDGDDVADECPTPVAQALAAHRDRCHK